jgi:arylformamidase
VHDITPPIAQGMPVWPGDPAPRQRSLQRLQDGDACDLSEWLLGSHTGAHVDAPSHFVPGGLELDELPLGTLVGPCRVLDLTSAAPDVAARDLPAIDVPERLLLKTANSLSHWPGQPFRTDYVGLSLGAARHLVDGGVRLVGADYLSVEPFASVELGAPVHRLLLRAGVVILEGLVLADVPPGEYLLVALPLRLTGSEAGPARVILL